MKQTVAAFLGLLLLSFEVQAQTIYWKKDHIYAGPGGGEIAIVTPPSSDTTVPSTPTGVGTNSVSAVEVTVVWTGSTDTGGSGMAGYKIYRQKGSAANLPVGTVGSSATQFTDKALEPSTTYTYRVVAFDNAQNHSAASSSTNATTSAVTSSTDTAAPSVPSGLTGTALSASVVRLEWLASTDTGGAGIGGYEVKRGSTVLNSGGTTPLMYEDTSAPASSTLSYSVRAKDGVGNLSSYSSTVNVTTPATIYPPTVPGNLAATATNSTTIQLTWNASSSTGGGVAGYKVYYYGTVVSGSNYITSTSFNYTGLTPNSTYQDLRVKAFDSNGNASTSAGPVSATTPPDTIAPSTPTDLDVEYSEWENEWYVAVTWTASTDTGGSGLLGYRLYGVYGNNEYLLDTLTDTEFYSLDYDYDEYRVRAVDNAGNVSGTASWAPF